MDNMQLATVSPVPDVQQGLERYNALVQFVNSVLHEGIDFGVIPGSDKKVLLKPGAEKLSTFFSLRPRFIEVEIVEDWLGKDHGNEPFFYYKILCQLSQGDQVIAECLASINSWETKYRYRKAERICPVCNAPAIIKGKEEYGGGWLCYKNKGGCGTKFDDSDARIVGQVVGQVANKQIFDQVNTMIKMVQKRALVGAVLLGVNASEFFTQDLEEIIIGDWTEAETPKPERKPEARKTEPAKARPQTQATSGSDEPPLLDEYGQPIETTAQKPSNGDVPKAEEPAGQEYPTYVRGVMTYRKVNGVEQVQWGKGWKPAQQVTGKDLTNASIEDLVKLFPDKKGEPDQHEAVGHLKKHFKKATFRACTWEELMALIMLKKQDAPDPDFYPDEYSAKQEAEQQLPFTPDAEAEPTEANGAVLNPVDVKRHEIRTFYGLPMPETEDSTAFLNAVLALPDPKILGTLKDKGLDINTPVGMERFLSVATLLEGGVVPTAGPEFDEVIGYAIRP